MPLWVFGFLISQWNGNGNIQKASQGLCNFLLFFIMEKKKKTRYVTPYAFYSKILPVPAFVAFSFIFWCLWGVGLFHLPHGPSKTVSTSGNRNAWTPHSDLGKEEDRKKNKKQPEAQTYIRFMWWKLIIKSECITIIVYICVLRNLLSSESNKRRNWSLTATTVFNLFGN